jgi:plasmid rolling circle replication initiator protein Rep
MLKDTIHRDLCENQEHLSSFKEHRLKSESENLGRFFAEAGDEKKAQRVRECGTYLAFELYEHRLTAEQKRKLNGANFCEVRWCPMCAWRKSRKYGGEMRSILTQLEALRPVKYVFLTLTIENPRLTELKDALKTMNRAFNLLTKSPEFKGVVLGYIRALEALGGSTPAGEAHPHYHCLLVVKPSYFTGRCYITQERWAELWQRCLRVDYVPVVDVRKVKPKSAEWTARDSAIIETVKYIAKPQSVGSLCQSDFDKLDRQMKGVKQYTHGGVLNDFKPEEAGNFSREEWKLIAKEFYQWLGKNYKQF